jgi:choline dehydrogenase-like flavoprotein
MGLDPATSVCDPAGRVHGRPGLTVADASIFPTIPRANTNIPAVVVGERIAQLLLGDRQR